MNSTCGNCLAPNFYVLLREFSNFFLVLHFLSSWKLKRRDMKCSTAYKTCIGMWVEIFFKNSSIATTINFVLCASIQSSIQERTFSNSRGCHCGYYLLFRWEFSILRYWLCIELDVGKNLTCISCEMPCTVLLEESWHVWKTLKEKIFKI